jgi:hypothetical protein
MTLGSVFPSATTASEKAQREFSSAVLVRKEVGKRLAHDRRDGHTSAACQGVEISLDPFVDENCRPRHMTYSSIHFGLGKATRSFWPSSHQGSMATSHWISVEAEVQR